MCFLWIDYFRLNLSGKLHNFSIVGLLEKRLIFYLKPELINSSNRQCFRIKVLRRTSHRKHREVRFFKSFIFIFLSVYSSPTENLLLYWDRFVSFTLSEKVAQVYSTCVLEKFSTNLAKCQCRGLETCFRNGWQFKRKCYFFSLLFTETKRLDFVALPLTTLFKRHQREVVANVEISRAWKLLFQVDRFWPYKARNDQK